MCNPTCPNCSYDLTGLINPDTPVDCPECNTHSTYAQATTRISRYPALQKSVILLFIAPQLIHLCSYIIFQSWEYSDNTLFAIGFIPVGLMFWYLLVATIILLVSEYRARKGKARSQVQPSSWVSYLAILICVLITMGVNMPLIGLWAAAIASV